MLVNMKEMLNKAVSGKYAVPHFNINNLEWTRFILEECQELNSPVILGVSEGAIKYMGGYKTVSNLVKSLISDLNITIPVALHLDHGSSYESCVKAIDNGFTSVMIDASKYPLEENINITKQVVLYAKDKNVTVEAEVGAVGGEEDGVADELAYAKIEDAVKLVDSTNIDFLAPALGSVHGIYKGKPKLDFERMVKIHELIKLPLVLHGGSGIPDELIKKSISCGITKININTELQIAWSNAVRIFLNENDKVYDPRKIIKGGEIAMKEMIKEKIILFGSNNKA
ncbi:MAG TPA: class II fructose-1,6-bisphosphate aldolase [Candidatus Faecisoma merdavium]|nr:class II fructose-1,6-bisphosphate aldolase [Candidatus Faecisoma merdavium]